MLVVYILAMSSSIPVYLTHGGRAYVSASDWLVLLRVRAAECMPPVGGAQAPSGGAVCLGGVCCW